MKNVWRHDIVIMYKTCASFLEINVSTSRQGDRLDDNDLMVKDADSTSSNHYSVRILGDTHNALNITYDTMHIEHPKLPENPASTAIFTSQSSIPISVLKSNFILEKIFDL